MSETSMAPQERAAVAILLYGMLGGFAASAKWCCCWPVALLFAWAATRRATRRGLLTPETGGLKFGLALGLVMGLIMASFGTAVQLAVLDEEAKAALLQSTPELNMGMVALVIAATNAVAGLLSGLFGGMFGGPKAPLRRRPMGPPPRRPGAVPVPGRMPPPRPGDPGSAQFRPLPPGHRPPPGGLAGPGLVPPRRPQGTAADVGRRAPAIDTGPPEEPEDLYETATEPSVPALAAEDFVTAESEPLSFEDTVEDENKASRDVERTVTLDQDPPEREDELAQWTSEPEPEAESEPEPED